MAEDEDLQLLRPTRPPQQPHQCEQVPDNEICERPEQVALLDHGKSAEPSEPDAPKSRRRVCEPYRRELATPPTDLRQRGGAAGTNVDYLVELKDGQDLV